MGLFSKKDKYEPKGKPLDFDPLNVTIRDLRPGFFVDYNFKTFEITGGFEYQLKEGSIKALKFDAADQLIWVLIENGLDTFLMESMALSAVNADFQKIMADFGKPPATVVFKEVTYTLDQATDGKFRDLSKNAMDWSRLGCWKFTAEDGKRRLYALQKGQGTFEAIVAQQVSAGEFGNFLPKI